MTFGVFKKMIAAYMNRDLVTFTVNDVDLIARAVNQARRWAERQHNFEYSRTSARIDKLHFTDGALLSLTVEDLNQVVPVSVKVIERAFLPFSDGSGWFPVDVVSRDKHMQRVKRHYDNVLTTDPKKMPETQKLSFWTIVRWGDRVYVSPADSDALGGETVVLRMDVVKWLPEYANDSDNDFFLDFCEDFLKFRTIYELNFMLKEDLRISISASALQDSWKTVKAWDASIIDGSSEDAELD